MKRKKRLQVRLMAEDARLTFDWRVLQADVDAVIHLEKRLAHALSPEDTRRNVSRLYNPRRIADLHALVPAVRFFSS